jgi:DNA-binding transcriptional MerR regulator
MPSKASARRRKPASQARTTTPSIPERGLKIGEAARALGVETFVLRFWETQFPLLKPKHTRTKHRFYQERDVEVLRVIKRLLHDEGFTIAGANKHIKEFGIEALMAGKAVAKAGASASSREREARTEASPIDLQARRVLNEVRRDLETIHKILED